MAKVARKKPGELGPNKANRRKPSYARDRQWLWDRGRRTCEIDNCGKKLTLARGKHNSMTLDHKKALSKQGYNRRMNYAPACFECNTKKGDS